MAYILPLPCFSNSVKFESFLENLVLLPSNNACLFLGVTSITQPMVAHLNFPH